MAEFIQFFPLWGQLWHGTYGAHFGISNPETGPYVLFLILFSNLCIRTPSIYYISWTLFSGSYYLKYNQITMRILTSIMKFNSLKDINDWRSIRSFFVQTYMPKRYNLSAFSVLAECLGGMLL